jgi:hypothetical protein
VGIPIHGSGLSWIRKKVSLACEEVCSEPEPGGRPRSAPGGRPPCPRDEDDLGPAVGAPAFVCEQILPIRLNVRISAIGPGVKNPCETHVWYLIALIRSHNEGEDLKNFIIYIRKRNIFFET